MLPLYSLEQAINVVLREDWGRILACINNPIRDLQLAEDSLQDALETALIKWKKNGLPKSPSAWLITTARRKAIDRIRRNKVFAEKQEEIAYLQTLEQGFDDILEMDSIPDKRLELIFTCCHPSLDKKTKIALTLRSIGGLTTEEIANAFLDDKQTMAQRLVRAKHKIKVAHIPYEVPGRDVLVSRANDVLSVIYLIFNEGYSASSGKQLLRTDLSEEAIRLGRIMHALLPKNTEVTGLLALMILHDSRCLARIEDNRLIPLEHQSRQKWDRTKITEGIQLIKGALVKKELGPYQLQAAISAIHSEALSWQDTDWLQISELYKLLYKIQPTAVVRINQAMAISHAVSIAAGLLILDEIKNIERIKTYQSYYLVKADLVFRAGQIKASIDLLRTALKLSKNEMEKNFIHKKLTELETFI